VIKDKVVIITGATRGIGKAILYRFAEEGAKIVGVYASRDELANTIQNELQTSNVDVSFYKGSITDQDFVRRMMEDVISKYGTIDVLVNNAGIVSDNFSTQMTYEDWNRVFKTNFQGTYCCSLEVLPYMKRQGKGKIVNVISVTGVLGREVQTNYGTSKGAIIGLTRMMARQYSAKGIHINAVAPGMINTEMIGHVPQEKLDNFIRHTNMRRLGEPDEVANSVLFLSSKQSDYIAGVVLKVDGGFIK
jgi:3-oxoacyl-[acyl-carrier protein] reductase